MLLPTKHSHPDRTIVHLSLRLLVRVRKLRLEDYDSLRAFAKRCVKGGEFLFLPSLAFLYLLGLVDYRPKTDSIEYTGPNEAL